VTKSPLGKILSFCPLWLIKNLSAISWRVHYRLDQKHVKECEQMVSLVDKGWDSKNTVLGMYRSLWSIPAEILWFQKNNDATCRAAVKGLDELIAYCDEIGTDKGIIFVSCHIGNWELGSRYISRYYRPISSVFKPHEKEWINNLLLFFRQQHNQTTLPKKGGLIALMRQLKQNSSIGLLIDQHGGQDGVDSEFLNQPCKSWDSSIQLAHRTKCPVVPIALIRVKNGFHYHFIKDYQLSLNSSGKLDIEKSCLSMDQALSKLVCLAPEQWLWLGRRWGRDFNLRMTSSSKLI